MDEKELAQGFASLNRLAEAEYHKNLRELETDSTPAEDSSLRIGRLVGVLMKKPFAKPVDLEAPSLYTGAYRGWELLDRVTFDQPSLQESWEHRLLDELAGPEGMLDGYQLAQQAQFERGFFGYLGRSVAGYICGDPKIRAEIERAVDDTRKAGFNIALQSPEVAVGSGGLILGAALVQSVPILGYVGAPIIAGFVLIIYRIGVNAFCQWINDHRLNSPLESKN